MLCTADQVREKSIMENGIIDYISLLIGNVSLVLSKITWCLPVSEGELKESKSEGVIIQIFCQTWKCQNVNVA